MTGRGDATPQLAAAAYLLHVAKDWTSGCFAAAQDSNFTMVPHRFELSGTRVRRCPLACGSFEAASPLEAVKCLREPTAWSHCTTVTLLVDHPCGTTAIEQEVVEVLAVEGAQVLAQAAPVVRIPGLGACLGAFRAP